MRRILMASTLVAALAAISLPSRAHASGESGPEETSLGAPGTTKGPGGILDASHHNRNQQISAFAFMPWAYGFGFGVGGRYALPIAKDGFIPTLNDSLELELGLDAWYASWGALGFSYGYVGLAAPVAEAAWTFHITSQFDAYAKLGAGLRFNFWVDSYASGSTVNFYLISSVGINYKFTEKTMLRAELGYTGLRAGLGFDL